MDVPIAQLRDAVQLLRGRRRWPAASTVERQGEEFVFSTEDGTPLGREPVTTPALLDLGRKSLADMIGGLIAPALLLNLSPDQVARAYHDALKARPKWELARMERMLGIPAQKADPLGGWVMDVFQRFNNYVLEHRGVALTGEISGRLTSHLRRWANERSGDEFASVEAPLPGLERFPIADAWVNLSMVRPGSADEVDPAGGTGPPYRGEKPDADLPRGVPVPFALDRLGEATLVVGDPGSGKTTLLKWMTAAVLHRTSKRFLIPLYVPLRQFADANGDLLTVALQSLGGAEEQELWLAYARGAQATEGHRNTFLLLLDGFDEVASPAGRARVREAVRDLRGVVPYLLTSRRDADAPHLGFDAMFEVGALPPKSARRLLRTWLTKLGSPELLPELSRRISANPDLRQLARVPFLLTVMCAVAHTLRRDADSQTTLFNQYADALARSKGSLDAAGIAHVGRLAYYLLATAPGCPKYVFEDDDVSAAVPDAGFRTALRGSRLVRSAQLRGSALTFAHRRFQDYFAADEFVRSVRTDPAEFESFLRARWPRADWAGVITFLAGRVDGPNAGVFWRFVGDRAKDVDLFDHVTARVAGLVAEARNRPGAEELVDDLRERLWARCETGEASDDAVDRLIALGAAALVGRFLRALADDTLKDILFARQALRRLPRSTPGWDALGEKLYGSDGAMAWWPSDSLEVGRIERLDALLATACDETADEDARIIAVRKLGDFGDVDDPERTERLVAIVRADGPEVLRREAAVALGVIQDEAAVPGLEALLGGPTPPALQEDAVWAIRDIGGADARDALVRVLYLLDPADPPYLEVLKALAGYPLDNGAARIAEHLTPTRDDGPLAVAAAAALRDAVDPVGLEALARGAQGHPNAEVRRACLAAMGEGTQPPTAHIEWLGKHAFAEGRDEDERYGALVVLLRALDTPALRRAGAAEFVVAAHGAAFARLLAPPYEPGTLTEAAARFAHVFRDRYFAPLCALVRDPLAPLDARTAGVRSLGAIGGREAEEVILSILGGDPATKSLLSSAVCVLGVVAPWRLLGVESADARRALQEYCRFTGALAFPDGILLPNGAERIRPDGTKEKVPPMPLPAPQPEPAAPVTRTVVVIATGWGPSFGGINAFNSDFCRALGRVLKGVARVVCLTTLIDDNERASLKREGLELVALGNIPDPDDWRGMPAFVENATTALANVGVTAPDLTIGHDVYTGQHAIDLRQKLGGESAVIHHMSYGQYQALRVPGPVVREKENRQRELFRAAQHVLAVGPSLQDSARGLVPNRPVTMLVPGMAEIEPGDGQPGTFRAIAFGRLGGADDRIKQGRLAVAAFGRFVGETAAWLNRKCRLNIFGLSEDEYEHESLELSQLAGKEAGRVVNVVACPYTEDRDELFQALKDNEVALMLSWHEGFGLVGWEAIAAGVPLIVSQDSGLYRLIRDDHAGRVESIDVLGSPTDELNPLDITNVVNSLKKIAGNLSDATRRAAELRTALRVKYTWDRCALDALSGCGFTVQINTAADRPAPPVGEKTPVVVQFVSGNSGGGNVPVLQVTQEAKDIEEGINRGAHREQFRLTNAVYGATLNDLIRCQRVTPTILHLLGHGDERRLELIEVNFRLPTPVALSPEIAATVFKNFTPRLRLVVLSACSSLEVARYLAGTGVVEAAVGAAGKISASRATAFSKALYEWLSDGKSLRQAFDNANGNFYDAAPESRFQLVVGAGIDAATVYFAGPKS